MPDIDPALWILVHGGPSAVYTWPFRAQWAWLAAILSELADKEYWRREDVRGEPWITTAIRDVLDGAWPPSVDGLEEIDTALGADDVKISTDLQLALEKVLGLTMNAIPDGPLEVEVDADGDNDLSWLWELFLREVGERDAADLEHDRLPFMLNKYAALESSDA